MKFSITFSYCEILRTNKEVIFMFSKKNVSKNKKTKPSTENASSLYEFANDQLGENKDAAFNDLANKQTSCKKKK